MEQIEYTEFGVKIIVGERKEVGKALIGMRSGKPFTMNNNLYINYDKKLWLVTHASFFDNAGNQLNRYDFRLDTATYVIGIILFKRQVLMIKRQKPGFIYHVFPGGHVREKEGAEEALVREMKEEVGLDISSLEKTIIFKQHKDGFGPETAFRIDNTNENFEFRKNDPDDPTSEMMLVDIDKILSLENPVQREVIEELLKRVSK